jgi:hypothetical protein
LLVGRSLEFGVCMYVCACVHTYIHYIHAWTRIYMQIPALSCEHTSLVHMYTYKHTFYVQIHTYMNVACGPHPYLARYCTYVHTHIHIVWRFLPNTATIPNMYLHTHSHTHMYTGSSRILQTHSRNFCTYTQTSTYTHSHTHVCRFLPCHMSPCAKFSRL